jgi:UPF0755 protein
MKWIKLFVILIIIISSGFYFTFYFTNVKLSDNNEDTIIYVYPATSENEFKDMLKQKKLLRLPWTFDLATKIKYFTVKPGRYKIYNGSNNNELINKIRIGDQEPIKLTFNNIRTIEELAEKISGQFIFTKEDFLQIIKDNDFLDSLGFNKQNIACIFLPNTYFFYWTTTPKEFVLRMKKEWDDFWTDERLQKAKKMNLSPEEVCILASIVEAETKKWDEMSIVAGVYINRLKRNMPLESDPTIIFAHQDFEIKRVLNGHLKINSPYNTYKNIGLPPGPILLPFPRTIDSVLNYQQHDYLFFCAKDDLSGYHTFSRTISEHQQCAKKYHTALDRLNIKR